MRGRNSSCSLLEPNLRLDLVSCMLFYLLGHISGNGIAFKHLFTFLYRDRVQFPVAETGFNFQWQRQGSISSGRDRVQGSISSKSGYSKLRLALLKRQVSASLEWSSACILVTRLGVVPSDQSHRRLKPSPDSRPHKQNGKSGPSCMGLAGYYQKFIPDFATIAAPLTDLTRKNAPNLVSWSPACEGAFTELKSRMCSLPVLRSPDFTKPFVVQTDASERGVGAVLSQLDDDGNDYPVSYYSRKLLPREERYATVEKECLAIRLAVHAFRVYLLGRPFTIQTDHRALEWLGRLKDKNIMHAAGEGRGSVRN